VEWLKAAADAVLSEKQKKYLSEALAVDSSYAIESFTRFRLNVFYQRGTISMAFRNIFTSVPTIESLGLPTVLATLCQRPQGLVLVCGPTGSGKSSTLAAMLQSINESRTAHIVTIEDPIEYLFRDNKSFITQREVGVDTIGYEIALKNAMRQDPDIILIGEVRSVDTMQTALSASETRAARRRAMIESPPWAMKLRSGSTGSLPRISRASDSTTGRASATARSPASIRQGGSASRHGSDEARQLASEVRRSRTST
jgi:Tfp pilus assembly pilus retraction ATPase PilT